MTGVEFEIGIGKTARRAYGFDEVAIVPSRRTRDPDDVDISWEVDAYRFGLPMMASAMDAGVSPQTAVLDRAARGTRVSQPRGPLDTVRGSRVHLRRDRRPVRRQGDPPDAGALQGAGEAGAARSSDRGDQGRGRGVVRFAHAPARRTVRTDRVGGRARHPGDPGDGGLGRARLHPDRAAQPQGVHRRIRSAGDRRGMCLVLDRAASHADRRRRRAGRGRSRERLHHKGCAGRRRAAGDRDRGRGRGPARAPPRDGPVLSRDRGRRDAHRR